MNRPLLKVIFFYLVGLLFGYYAELSCKYIFCLGLSFFLFAFFIPRVFLKMRNISLALGIVFLAAAWLSWQLNEGTNQPFWGKELFLEGEVIQDLTKEKGKTTFLFQLQRITDQRGQVFPWKEKLQITVKGEEGVEAGELIRVKGCLEHLPQGRNPGQSSYGLYLASQGIRGIVTNGRKIEKLGHSSGINYWVGKGKKKMEQNLERFLPCPFASLTKGIVFGQAQALDNGLQQDFKKLGLTHVLAASGQNMLIIIGFALALSNGLKINPTVGTVISLIFIILYTLAAGSSPSVVRAALMAFFYLLAPLLGRKGDGLNTLGGVALIMLFFQPLLLWNVSFQLSFLAVLSLVLIAPFLEKYLDFLPSFLRNPLAVWLAVQLGVIPLSIYYFNQVSLISLLGNLIILPFLEGILIVGLMLAVLGVIPFLGSALAGWLWSLAFASLNLTHILAKFPWASLSFPSPSLEILLVYYGALVSFLYIIKKRERKKTELVIWALTVGVVCLSLIFIQSNSKTLTIVFLDVGQGDAIFIQTPRGKTILLDGGGQASYYKQKFDIGRKVVLPFLWKKGVGKLDLLIISHWHEDHIGGLVGVLDQIPVRQVLAAQEIEENPSSRELKKLFEEKGLVCHLVTRGQDIPLDSGINLRILHPGPKLLENTHSDENNNCLVVKLTYGQFSLLLTGDLEKEGEEEVMRAYPSQLKSDVLKVGHHGSAFSTQEKFLAQIQPEVAVISVGAHNSFGHPSRDTLARLRKIKVYRTDQDGGIIIETQGKGYLVKTVRKEKDSF